MITKKKILAGVCAFLFAMSLLFATSVRAANYYYVSPTGNDTNPGSLAQPWKTIQKAADTMATGDTVIVSSGDYSSQRINITKSGSSGLPITFRAQGKVVTKGFSVIANHIIISGFEIANTDYRRWDRQLSSGIYIKGADNTIENNYIHDASLEGIYLYGPPTDALVSHDNLILNNKLFQNELIGIEVNGRNNIIDGNEVWATVQCHPNMTRIEDAANGTKCPSYSNPSGMDADGMRFFGQGHIFRNNNIHDIRLGYIMNGVNVNPNPHIDCFQTFTNINFEVAQYITFENNFCNNTDPKMSAFMIEGGANHLYIHNNIFITCEGLNAGGSDRADYLYINNNIWANTPTQRDISAAGVIIGGFHAEVKNNIFYDQPNIPLVILGNTTNTDVDYNLAYNSDGTRPDCVRWGNYDICQPTPNHELWNINPQFVNPASGDYHLQTISPAIDAGYNVGITSDFDGVSRPQGLGYDIGAFEIHSIQPPTITQTSTQTSTAIPSSPTTPALTATPTPTATTIPAGVFTKVTPIDMATDLPTSVTLEWESSGEAVYYYMVCVDTINNSMCDGSWIETVSTSAAFSGLLPGTMYYWEVIVVKASGSVFLDNGVWWSFSVVSNPLSGTEVPTENAAANFTPTSTKTPIVTQTVIAPPTITNTPAGTLTVVPPPTQTPTHVSTSTPKPTTVPQSSIVAVFVKNGYKPCRNMGVGLADGVYKDGVTYQCLFENKSSTVVLVGYDGSLVLTSPDNKGNTINKINNNAIGKIYGNPVRSWIGNNLSKIQAGMQESYVSTFHITLLIGDASVAIPGTHGISDILEIVPLGEGSHLLK